MSWIILTFVVGVVNLVLGYVIAVLLGYGPRTLREAWAACAGTPSARGMDPASVDAMVNRLTTEAEETQQAVKQAPKPPPPEATLRDVVLSLRDDLPKNEAKLIDVDTALRSAAPTAETNQAQVQAVQENCQTYLDTLGKKSAEIQSQLALLGPFKPIGQQIDMALVEQSTQIDAAVRNLAQSDVTSEPATAAGYLKREVVAMVGLMHQLRDYLATTFMDIVWQDKRLRETAESETLDELTEVPNRIGFELALQERWEQNRFREQAHSAILFDIDDLAELDQEHGVAAGKHVLRTLVARLREGQGPTDAIFRFSGQQFVILQAGVEGAAALQTAKRISETIQAATIPFGQSMIAVSLTGAVVQILPTSAPRDILARFDDALSTAKRIARGRVYLADKNKAPPQMFKAE
ncbi:MAG: GGDEF domain-containing protein [Thermoguttaceae bacterium]|jgi:diguanylate cyclase (GGDEF)-like protein